MFEKQCNLVPTMAFKQHWSQSRFSYMKNPRPNYGIMLVLNGQIDFVSLQMDTLCAKAGDIIFLPKNSYYEARFRIELGEIDNYLINFVSDSVFVYTKPMLISENTSFACVDLFQQFIDEMYNAEDMNLRIKGLFYLLLDSALSTSKAPKSTHNTILEKAKLLLKNRRYSHKQNCTGMFCQPKRIA